MASAITPRIAKILKSGGHLLGKNKQGKKVKLTHSKQGGIAVGDRHSDPSGGISGEVGTDKKPIKFEGREVVITTPAVEDPTLRDFQGKKMNNRQILSAINVSGGGVSFADGGEIPGKITYHKKNSYKVGGKVMTAQEVVEYCGCGCDHSKMADGGYISFSDKVTAIAKSLKGQPVPAQYRKEYGKTYTDATAKEAATKIAGAMVRNEKMEKGGQVGTAASVKASDAIDAPGLKYTARIKSVRKEPNGKYIAIWESAGQEQWCYVDELELTNGHKKLVEDKDWDAESNHNYWKCINVRYEQGGQTSDSYEKLLADFKNIDSRSHYVLKEYKDDPEGLIKFVQEQATGLASDRIHVGWPLAYQPTVEMVGADLTHRSIALMSQTEKDMLIKAWKGKLVPKELREAVKGNIMEEGGETGKQQNIDINTFQQQFNSWRCGPGYTNAITLLNERDIDYAGWTDVDIYKWYLEHEDDNENFSDGGHINRNDIKADLALGGLLDHRARDYKLLKSTVDFPDSRYESGGQLENSSTIDAAGIDNMAVSLRKKYLDDE